MAWRKLGVAYVAMNGAYPQSLVDSALTHAFIHRDRLTAREREMTTASYYLSGPGRDRARAAEAYQQMLASGDSEVALNNYGLVLISQRRWADAEAVLAATARFPGTARAGLDNLARRGGRRRAFAVCPTPGRRCDQEVGLADADGGSPAW